VGNQAVASKRKKTPTLESGPQSMESLRITSRKLKDQDARKEKLGRTCQGIQNRVSIWKREKAFTVLSRKTSKECNISFTGGKKGGTNDGEGSKGETTWLLCLLV